MVKPFYALGEFKRRKNNQLDVWSMGKFLLEATIWLELGGKCILNSVLMVWGFGNSLIKTQRGLSFFTNLTNTTKKSSCPSFFSQTLLKTAVIDKPIPALFESTGIGNPITAAQNRRFKNRCNKRLIAAVFKNAGIGSLIVLK